MLDIQGIGDIRTEIRQLHNSSPLFMSTTKNHNEKKGLKLNTLTASSFWG